MTNRCGTCGHTESEACLEAKTLGLHEEFQSGIYTCCQIAEWATEQALAWFEATRDFHNSHREDAETDAELVPVRSRRLQVPWYRKAGNLG